MRRGSLKRCRWVFWQCLKTFALRLWAVLFFPVNWSQQPGLVFGIVMVFYLVALLWLLKAQVTWRDVLVPVGIPVGVGPSAVVAIADRSRFTKGPVSLPAFGGILPAACRDGATFENEVSVGGFDNDHRLQPGCASSQHDGVGVCFSKGAGRVQRGGIVCDWGKLGSSDCLEA